MSSNPPWPRRSWLLLVLTLLLLGVMATAHAQSRGGHGGRQKTQQPAPQPSPAPTSTTPAAQPGQLLNAGAILCVSRDDLVRYQTEFAEGANLAAVGPGSNCHKIAKQVAIRVLDRDGPSRTQVVTADDPQQTGWTNAYLPSAESP